MTTLREAAEALLAQWDSPDQGPCHLAPRIAQLRAALAAPPLGMAEIERLLGDVLPPVRRMARRIDEPWSTQEEAIAIDAADEADLHGLRTARAMLLTAIGDALAQARREGIEAAAAHADLFVELQSNAENGDVAEQVAASIRRALGAAP